MEKQNIEKKTKQNKKNILQYIYIRLILMLCIRTCTQHKLEWNRKENNTKELKKIIIELFSFYTDV